MRFGSMLAAFAGACLTVGCSDDNMANRQASMAANQATASPVIAPAENNDRRPIILAFGDSLYAGYNLPQDQGFAPELERALAARKLSFRVHNAGVSGDTSATARARLAFALDGLGAKPALVIVGLGGNDMLRGLRPEETRANLAAILEELKRREIPAMLTGMLASPNMGADYAAQFNPIYPDLARQYRVPLYPFFLDGVVGNPRLQLPDGIHPNEAGVDAIVARLAPKVADSVTG